MENTNGQHIPPADKSSVAPRPPHPLHVQTHFFVTILMFLCALCAVLSVVYMGLNYYYDSQVADSFEFTQ